MKRLRPKHSAEKLAEIYSTPHDYEEFWDHRIRADITVGVGVALLERRIQNSSIDIVDLSCGNGRIARYIGDTRRLGDKVILGDFAPGYEFTGPIESTIHFLNDYSDSMLILSETLEHLDKPERILEVARRKCDYLLLSTPIDEPHNSKNEQHYWSWSVDDIKGMLRNAGWEPQIVNELYLPTYYDFMIMGCS